MTSQFVRRNKESLRENLEIWGIKGHSRVGKANTFRPQKARDKTEKGFEKQEATTTALWQRSDYGC